MASEQIGGRKKQSKITSREEHCHQVLYRHQDCIPNRKLIQNCERTCCLGPKNIQELQCHGKLTHELETNDLKVKQVNSKLKKDGKSEKIHEPKSDNQQLNGTLGNSEELSKSRKRRLRKRRLLVSLAPSLNNTKVDLLQETAQQTLTAARPIARSSSVAVPLSPSTSTHRPSDSAAKPSAKDSRKRLDKSVGSRGKSIKTKSLVDTTNQSKVDIIKTLEEKTLSSLLQTLAPLTNSSPKKEKPLLSFFSFPEKRLNCTDTKVDKDGVFYFGETKHQLEKLASGLNNCNTSLVQEKSEFAQSPQFNRNCFSATNSNLENCLPSFNFSALNNSRLSTLATAKQNLYDTETVPLESKIEFKEVFPTLHTCHQAEEGVFKTPVFNSLNQSQAQVLSLNKSPLCSPNTSVITNSDICENNKIYSDTVTPVSDVVIKPPEIAIKTSEVAIKSSGIVTKQPDYIIKRGENPKSAIVKSAEESKSSQDILKAVTVNSPTITMKSAIEPSKSTKTREEILQEREAKKAAKLSAKTKHKNALKADSQPNNTNTGTLSVEICQSINSGIPPIKKDTTLKINNVSKVKEISPLSKEDENKVEHSVATSFGEMSISSQKKESANVKVPEVTTEMDKDSTGKSKAELRAERRAKQEAQRAAKATSKTVQPQLKEKVVPQIKSEQQKADIGSSQVEKKQEVAKSSSQSKPKLFSHLYQEKAPLSSNEILKVGSLHPAVVRLGVQYTARVVVGSNARCVALLHALKQMVNDYTTPSEKEFSRGLEEELGPVMVYLNCCRPLAVSMTNALRHIKRTLTQLPNNIPDLEARRKVCDVIDTYVHEQIDTAGKAICNTVKQKIANGDVILTYGCSSLVYKILVESHLSGTRFRVVVVDGLPWREGREMLRRLVDKGLSCTYVLITAASFIMREASKVLLGAHALLANGYVMSRAGSSQVALLAHCYNVPVLVCCETHKFCERVQTDAFVYNELGELCCGSGKDKGRLPLSLTPLSLAYDITPPDLVSAVVTELAVLPCTSVPVILRIKPSESVM